MTFRPLDTHVPLSAFNYVHLALNSTELKLVTQVHPYMQMLILPAGGQHGLRGQSINLPVPMQEICSALPRKKRLSIYLRLCFRYTNSTLSLLIKSEISSFYAASGTVHVGLCQTFLETPKTGFLASRLINIEF